MFGKATLWEAPRPVNIIREACHKNIDQARGVPHSGGMEHTATAVEPVPLEDVFAAAGGYPALAEAIGVHRTTPLSWTRVPAERVFAVAKATGLPLAKLRPDLFDETP